MSAGRAIRASTMRAICRGGSARQRRAPPPRPPFPAPCALCDWVPLHTSRGAQRCVRRPVVSPTPPSGLHAAPRSTETASEGRPVPRPRLEGCRAMCPRHRSKHTWTGGHKGARQRHQALQRGRGHERAQHGSPANMVIGNPIQREHHCFLVFSVRISARCAPVRPFLRACRERTGTGPSRP